MVYDTARKLAEELRASEEYQTYAAAKDVASENSATKALIDQYHRLQVQVQAASLAGTPSGDMMEQLKKLGELLQFDAAASAYLMAEFRLNRMLADIYKMLAEAVGNDLSALENR